MNYPQAGDYINIHTHGDSPASGIFLVENLMAHDGVLPSDIKNVAWSFGIHPWYLDENNHEQLISSVRGIAGDTSVVAIGEAGFDKIKGPDMELQIRTFKEQVTVSEDFKKPLFIHCVKAWDELLAAHKNAKPEMPWMVHGFRGGSELAAQLISKGLYLSFWFGFVMRPESADLLRSLPTDRIFLETDGADVDIRDIYNKVSTDLGISVDDLKSIILTNFRRIMNYE